MAHTEEELKCLGWILETCKRLHEKNFLAAADGNVSYRFNDNRILITPSGRPKGFLETKDIAIINLDGEVIHGEPSGEKAMHLEVYRNCPEAKAVVHAHPPTAIAWTIAQPDLKELPSRSIPEVILATGGVPIIPYARPTTEDMGERVRPYLPDHRVMILARHGALSWGEKLEEAYMGMERLEHTALILKEAYVLGGITELPEEEIQSLREMRKQIGPKTL